MISVSSEQRPEWASDAELVALAAAGDSKAVRAIIQGHNQRLYRLVRAVLRSNSDAEEVLQEAYLNAFRNLDGFKGEASLSTWLSRIALNAALLRLRAEKQQKRVAPDNRKVSAQIISFPVAAATDDPERIMAQRQLLHLVEQATDALPDQFRLVFIARVIEGLSVEETAGLLNLPPATVKTRLHRARKLIREAMEDQIGPILMEAFPFAGTRCQRLTDAVMSKLDLRD